MKKSLIILTGLLTLMASCSKDEKEDNATLKNDFIKRTVSPLMVGTKIDFAYGAGTLSGVLGTMEVVASIPGDAGTAFETVTHRTVNALDVTKTVATSSVTNGAVSTAAIIDTNATTLRYAYVIPEVARGKKVSFTFSVTTKGGEKATISTPEYTISKMDMVRTITMAGTPTGSRYFSIAAMRSYTQAEVDAGSLSGSIDFVYAYAATVTPGTTAYTYGHSFVSPAAPAAYFPAGFTLPATWNKNNTLMEKKIGSTVYDGQLKGDVNSNIYVDDRDLQVQTFEGSANFALSMSNDGSIFMKTADGKYTAFIYINSVTNASSTAVISIKRYQNL